MCSAPCCSDWPAHLECACIPTGMLRRHPHDQLRDLAHDGWSSRASPLAEVPLLRHEPHEPLVPAQQGVGGCDGVEFEQGFAVVQNFFNKLLKQRPISLADRKTPIEPSTVTGDGAQFDLLSM